MKVLILHNRYQQRGGEDAVVAQEASLLQRNGVQVELVLVSNDQIRGAAAKLSALVKTPYDRDREAWAVDLVTRLRADIVHIHNFFPLLTPAVHVGAAAAGAAVVQTLHNYRLLCANAMFLRRGRVCEDCVKGGRHNAVVHRCYRGSIAGTLAVVQMQAQAERRIWATCVHRFIALTEFSRAKFIEGGLPPGRIVIKPNFMPSGEERSGAPQERKGGLFVGRISAEKGLRQLLLAWPASAAERLTIVGDGPDLPDLQAAFSDRASFLGHQGRDRIKALMAEAAFLIVPSIWYEGFPMTIVEAFAAGLPVIASDIGSLSSIIEDGQNGLKFLPASSQQLQQCILALLENRQLREHLARGARRSFETRYSEESNASQLLAIYKSALAETSSATGSLGSQAVSLW
jgi:glycosyltransferase involved in cell wall biosynthesis